MARRLVSMRVKTGTVMAWTDSVMDQYLECLAALAASVLALANAG
jgi:hypothetical protein